MVSVSSNDGESVSADQRQALPSWWCVLDAANPDCDTYHDLLNSELTAEVPPNHLLNGVQVEALAHDICYDDVLYQHVDEPSRFTCVHLTWSGSQEVEGCPSIECDGTWADFLAWCGAVDEALQQASQEEADGLREPMGAAGTPSKPVVVQRPERCEPRVDGLE